MNLNPNTCVVFLMIKNPRSSQLTSKHALFFPFLKEQCCCFTARRWRVRTHLCVEFACFPSVCLGFFQVLLFFCLCQLEMGTSRHQQVLYKARKILDSWMDGWTVDIRSCACLSYGIADMCRPCIYVMFTVTYTYSKILLFWQSQVCEVILGNIPPSLSYLSKWVKCILLYSLYTKWWNGA